MDIRASVSHIAAWSNESDEGWTHMVRARDVYEGLEGIAVGWRSWGPLNRKVLWDVADIFRRLER